MKDNFVVYVDFDSTLYDTPRFSNDLRKKIADKTGLTVDQIKQDGGSHFFHPTLGGYEYEKHIVRYNLDPQEMWHELDVLLQRENYLYPDSKVFIEGLYDTGYQPKILTFGEKRFQLAKIYSCLQYFGNGTIIHKDDVIVVDKKKNQHISTFHEGQIGVLLDDKPDQRLPEGFTEIHISRHETLDKPVVNGSVVKVCSLAQAETVIRSLSR